MLADISIAIMLGATQLYLGHVASIEETDRRTVQLYMYIYWRVTGPHTDAFSSPDGGSNAASVAGSNAASFTTAYESPDRRPPPPSGEGRHEQLFSSPPDLPFFELLENWKNSNNKMMCFGRCRQLIRVSFSAVASG